MPRHAPLQARLLAAGAAVLAAVSLVACGASRSTTATVAQSAARRGGFVLGDPKVRACLQKQGVTLPSGRRNGPRPNGRFRGSAQFQKLREALAKCGVTFPNRGGNGAPPAPSQNTTPTTAS